MRPMPATDSPLMQATRIGQSLWYDGLLSPAEFKKLISDDGVRGATTNPTIFEKAVSSGAYDAVIRSLKNESEEAIFKNIAIEAVKGVADTFLPLYEATQGKDGFVSIEVSPFLARDTQNTIEEGRELWSRIQRKNLMIKVPATKEGLPAIRALIADGISVNVTLIFSVERYREVMDAYLSGLEDRIAQKKSIANVASVASFFVSRVDSVIDAELEKKGVNDLLGKAGIANSKAAYKEFQTVFGSPRFTKLKSQGAQLQRPLWASTGTKNPKYSDCLYVEALMGPDTVNTIPPATMDAFRDHGIPGDNLAKGTEEALRSLEALKKAGINLLQVTQTLEEQGVKLFSESFTKIIDQIRLKKNSV